MTNHQSKYQPGRIFHDVFCAGLRMLGSSVREFAAKNGLQFQNLRSYATGYTNGPKAEAVRNLMINEVGPDLFDAMYRERLKRDKVTS